MDGQNMTDDERDIRSLDTAKFFDQNDDLTHQEFKDEADTNKILSRFGVTGQLPNMRPLTFGETDYDLDLQRALGAIHQAREAHMNLPPALKARYPNWQSLLAAAERGTLDIREETTPPPSPVSQNDTDPPQT